MSLLTQFYPGPGGGGPTPPSGGSSPISWLYFTTAGGGIAYTSPVFSASGSSTQTYMLLDAANLSTGSSTAGYPQFRDLVSSGTLIRTSTANNTVAANITSIQVDTIQQNPTGGSNYTFNFAAGSQLTSFTVGKLRMGSQTTFDFSNCSLLTDVDVTTWETVTFGTAYLVDFNGCSLNQKSVDNILVAIASSGVVSGSLLTLNLGGVGNAAPSAAVGVPAKNYLISTSATVLTN